MYTKQKLIIALLLIITVAIYKYPHDKYKTELLIKSNHMLINQLFKTIKGLREENNVNNIDF